jgi:TolB-like protein/DNA-binding winged helix-turn-helix (wHTH) protein/Tfp pilus assembly protein PilF
MPGLGSRFRFGSFELDCAFGELRKRGLRIHLEDQPFRVLAALVERSGAVLTRDELRTTVWPDGTYVDFDRSLNRAINKVRLALGDSAANPRFIETLPRRGYRFVAPVSPVDSGADFVSAVSQSNGASEAALPAGRPQEAFLSSSSSVGGPTRLSRRSLLAGGGSLALAAMASYAFLGRQPIDSIAVLPFVNAGGDPDSEYLGEGISEALITSLSRLPGLKVLSRDTVFRYQAPGRDVRELRREFGVRGALSGTLTHQGDSLIVSAELVDTSNGAILWRNQYRRPVTDILEIEQEIANEIAEQLQLRLTGEEQHRLRVPATRSPEAFRLYLLGRYHWSRRPVGLENSREYFRQAVEKDPAYALAWVGLGDSFLMLGGWSLMPPDESYRAAQSAARRAIEIDETLAEPHATLAFVKGNYEWDWTGAEREFQRAIELNRNYATAHHLYAYHLMAVGRMEEAIAEIKRAWDLDPLSAIINAGAITVHALARRYEQAAEAGRKALQLDPEFAPTYTFLSMVHVLQGRQAQARSATEKALQLSGRGSIALSYAGSILAFIGQTQEARKLVEELVERARKEYVKPNLPAMIYANLGETDKALRCLDQALEQRPVNLAVAFRNPMLDSIRSDARFPGLFERMGLPA